MKAFQPRWCHQWRHSVTLNIALYFRLYEKVAMEPISKINILGSKVTLEIIFLDYLWLITVLRNENPQDRRSKVNVTGLPGDLDIETVVALSFAGVIWWNKNWNVGIPMATCMLLWQSRFGFSFGFHDRWRRPLTPILDGMVVKLDDSLDWAAES